MMARKLPVRAFFCLIITPELDTAKTVTDEHLTNMHLDFRKYSQTQSEIVLNSIPRFMPQEKPVTGLYPHDSLDHSSSHNYSLMMMVSTLITLSTVGFGIEISGFQKSIRTLGRGDKLFKYGI